MLWILNATSWKKQNIWYNSQKISTDSKNPQKIGAVEIYMYMNNNASQFEDGNFK